MLNKKAPPQQYVGAGLDKKVLAATYSPGHGPVPSALGGLTALFGMGRGAPPRNGRQHACGARTAHTCALSRQAGVGSSLFRGKVQLSRAQPTKGRLCIRPASQKFEKIGSVRAISTARLEHIAALPPAAYRRGSLPRPSSPEGHGTFISEPASHLDAFSAYPFRT